MTHRSVALALSIALPACGAPPAPSAPADPIPAHESFTIESRVLGESRLINVHVPRGRSGAPLPVLFMPDGGLDEDFPHVVAAVESLIERGAIRPVIVVGIPNTQRRRDLTGATHVAAELAAAPVVGGSAAFRRFVRDELVPEIGRRYRTTSERSIVGESLAGLFVVETFLEDPSLFTHCVAFDPSLWWNKGALVAAAPARLKSIDAAPRTLYLASSRDDIDDDTTRFAACVRDAALPGLRFRHDPRPDLTHATIFRALELTALEDALR